MLKSLKRILGFLSGFILLVMVFTNCNNNAEYNQNVTIPAQGWYKNNAVSFNININDSLTGYDFALNIRNTTNYRYSNLYVFMITEFPNGNISRDTIECILANNEGKWLGKGWGDIKENQITLKTDLHFPLTGNYRFLIQQAMRVDTLIGIHDIGLSLITE